MTRKMMTADQGNCHSKVTLNYSFSLLFCVSVSVCLIPFRPGQVNYFLIFTPQMDFLESDDGDDEHELRVVSDSLV